MAHAGSLVYLGLFGLWIVGLVAGHKPPNFGAMTYVGVLCFPISIARLRGKRLDDIWIIGGSRLEHRPRVGNTTFHGREDGWAPQPLARKKRSGHLWVLELRKPAGTRPRKVEIVIDDRENDPQVIEARVTGVLGSKPR